MNRVQLAELQGVHPDTVTDRVRQGMPMITAGGAGREGVYDAVECMAWQRQREGKNAKEMAQTELYAENARIARLKRAILTQTLVPRDQMIREGQALVRAWQAMVRRLPRRLANLGVIRRDQEAAVVELLRDVLDEASRWKTQADLASVGAD